MANKIQISHYASVIIIPNGRKRDKILTSVYDGTYPKEIFRNNIKLIGGNGMKEDDSPRGLFEREIGEEFSGIAEEQTEVDETIRYFVGEGLGAKKATNLASEKDTFYVRNQLLCESVPYRDFLTYFPLLGGSPSVEVLVSTFLYDLKYPQKFFNVVESNLSGGKSLINEGLLKVTPIEDILSGKVKCAWETGEILGHFLNEKIPNLHGIRIEEVGMPRQSFEDYSDDFEIKPRK